MPATSAAAEYCPSSVVAISLARSGVSADPGVGVTDAESVGAEALALAVAVALGDAAAVPVGSAVAVAPVMLALSGSYTAIPEPQRATPTSNTKLATTAASGFQRSCNNSFTTVSSPQARNQGSHSDTLRRKSTA